MYGPVGVSIGGGLGILRVSHADYNKKGNVVPVDYVINAMITSAYETAITRYIICKFRNFIRKKQFFLDRKLFLFTTTSYRMQIRLTGKNTRKKQSNTAD